MTNATIVNLSDRVNNLRRRPAPALTFQTSLLNLLAVATIAADEKSGDIHKCLQILSIALQRADSLDMPVDLTANEAQVISNIVDEAKQ